METEKKVVSGNSVRLTNHKIVLDNRKVLSITGVKKMESINETHAEADVGGSVLSVLGKNMHILKLDVEQGVLEIEGEIDAIKYLGEKKSVLKRIFK